MRNLTTIKKALAVTVSAVVLASVVATTPFIQQQETNIGEEVGAQQAQKFKAVTRQTTDNLNLRSLASTKGKVLLSIPKGTKVVTDTKVGNWYKVSYKGKTGYVSGSYLKPVTATKAPAPKKPTAKAPAVSKTYQTTASLNVRSSASVKGKLLVTIPKGKQVVSNTSQNGWVKVTYNKKTGWVSGSYLKEVKKATAKPAPKKAPAVSAKPVPKAPVKSLAMTRAQAESHLAKGFDKTGNGVYDLATSAWTLATVNFYTASGNAELVVNGIMYYSNANNQPEDFGQDAYEASRKYLGETNSAILLYSETQFGAGSADAKRLLAEVKSFTLASKKDQVKQFSLQGKTVRMHNMGSGSIVITNK